MNDLISRQAAISICDNAIDLWNGQLGTGALVAVRDAIMALPSAQPETKQGEWIPHSEMYTFQGTELTSSGGVICSSCGFRTHNRMHKLIGCPYNYCPICGTAMRKKNKNG